ncbi:hypothetical protein C0Q70_09402 [Pomacea canaliculata]|uniref:Granulins domain-containing protein n=1 Tax=Pomacea canaliculata TaxID=400727 RepID=A0A2T7P9P8_POMCA|nr:granulins-like isoform X2 [Pomacea canaliculata]PVD30140.1 hypothetical protein C0Q70_09402 [Pomacea canaliculata]
MMSAFWLAAVSVLLVASMALGQERDVKCENGKSCPDGTTCCKTANSEIVCCPFPSAVCCSDKIHCCPQNTKCDVSNGTCIQKDNILRFLSKEKTEGVKKTKAASLSVPGDTYNRPIHILSSGWQQAETAMEELREKWTTCPDDVSECPSGNTCCRLKSGVFGCCPFENAVCCADGIHCCPEDFHCNETQRICNSKKLGFSMSWMDRKPIRARPVVRDTANLTCPNNKTVCQQNDTCCNATSDFGCCPLSQAVCCKDNAHCCPRGSVCDLVNKRCIAQDNWIQPMVERQVKNPVTTVKVPTTVTSSNILSSKYTSKIVCPDGETQCPDNNTCCPTTSGESGCCPLPQAVCCSDKIHCCPAGTVCNLTSSTCDANQHSKQQIGNQPVEKVLVIGSVICPGGQYECPDGNTCCPIGDQYGCCPLPNAVCCSDGEHCCPQGYKCDVSAGQCIKGEQSVAWHKKKPALVKESLEPQCPDKKTGCPGGQTCCQSKSGDWGCCPLSNAVCCSDGVHCCPQYFICNSTTGKCDARLFSVAWSEKQLSFNKQPVGNVICPDGQSECGDGQTCCQQKDGTWGCCPLPNAVCCTDGVHCCPQGTTCNLSTGQCDSAQISVPWQQKLAAIKQISTENVICPDKKSECSDGQTCCRMGSGQFGCCGVPNAVCCQDGLHCCPQNYTCDETSGQCQLNSIDSNQVCPDGKSQCEQSETCCLLTSGSYGCCPHPSAVCCADHLHCCPQGFTCDTAKGQCLQSGIVKPWVQKKLAQPLH